MSEAQHPLSSPASATRCAVCHDGLTPAEVEEHWTCLGCGTYAHPECVGDLQRCPTLGCQGELPTGARAQRYHEMLEQRDGWLLRLVARISAGLGALLGGVSGLSGGADSILVGVLVGTILGAMTLGLIGTALAFVIWELYRKLAGVREPWDA